MKPKTTLTALAVLMPAVLMAGEAEYTRTTTQPSYVPPSDHVGWFLGGGVDYLVDAEEPFYNGHLGYDFGAGHALFLESGWVGEEEDAFFPFPANVDLDIVPITLNYKYEHALTERFGLYMGLGAGAASVDISAPFVSDDDWVLAAQAFAGVVYEFTPNFEMYAGARYVWLDDVSLFGANFGNLDDVGVGAGLRFNF